MDDDIEWKLEMADAMLALIERRSGLNPHILSVELQRRRLLFPERRSFIDKAIGRLQRELGEIGDVSDAF